jgi:hypothetical protein
MTDFEYRGHLNVHTFPAPKGHLGCAINHYILRKNLPFSCNLFGYHYKLFHIAQNSSGVCPASYPITTKGLFPRRGGGEIYQS